MYVVIVLKHCDMQSKMCRDAVNISRNRVPTWREEKKIILSNYTWIVVAAFTSNNLANKFQLNLQTFRYMYWLYLNLS